MNFRRQFKQGIDGADQRRNRQDEQLSMRRKDRREALNKRRMGNDKAAVETGGDMGPAESSTDIQARLQALPGILQGIQSSDPEIIHQKVMQIRKMLSIERNPPIQPIIDSGIVPTLIKFLQRTDNPGLQFEASWAITNIASGTTEHTQKIIEAGAVPIFIQLLSSPNDDVREQAVWALGNIAGDSTECRNLVLEGGVLPPLLKLCDKDSKITLLRNATWTISNLCRGKPQVPFEAIKACLPVLAHLLFTEDEEVLTDACWAFSYISDDTGPQNEKIAEVIKCGAVPRLVHLLSNKSNAVKHPALRTIGNIVTGDDLQTQVVINNGALLRLVVLLTNQKKAIRKEACWTISNITAGSVEQIEAVLQNSLFQPVIALLQKGEFDVKKEAAWAISNATSGGNVQQIRYLVNLNCIQPLCALLNSNNNKVIMVALEGLENILRVGEADKAQTGGSNHYATKVEEAKGLDYMEALQEVQELDEEIYDRVVQMISKYFGGEEDAYVQGQNVEQQAGAQGFGMGQQGMGQQAMGQDGAFNFNVQQQNPGSGGFNF